MKENLNQPITRRSFVAAAGLGALASPSFQVLAQAPQILTKRSVRPVVVAAANGNRSKDGAGLTCMAKAFQMITAGADVLDAVIAGVNIVELDPEDTSVGYGGLPNADGVVQLDASVMHGPRKRAGAVACLEGVRTPSLVAKRGREPHEAVHSPSESAFSSAVTMQKDGPLNTPNTRKQRQREDLALGGMGNTR